MDQLKSSLDILGSGMRAQSERLKIISQNLANKDTSSINPEEDPYRRKLIHFENYLDQANNAQKVRISHISEDQKDFELRFEPNHPGADKKGYVKYSNVTGLIEVADMQQASRSYQAQLNSFRLTRQLQQQTIAMLKN